MTKQPQDHKPAHGERFKFTGPDGKSYTLPFVSEGKKGMSGRAMRDAALGGEIGQLGYMIKILENSKPTPEALDALYDLPEDDMVEVLGGWGNHGDGSGASLGESDSSSS